MNRVFQSTAFFILAAGFTWSSGSCPASAADHDDAPSVTATGHATLKVKPEIMRCRLLLSAQGKTVQEAVTALAEHRDEVKQKLSDSGATATSFDITDPIIGTGTPNALAAQMQRIRMMSGGQQKIPATQPVSFTVSCTLQADWPRATGASDDALVTAMALQDKIKAAIPKGSAKKALTPEEQEVAEEVASQSAQSDPNEPAAAKPDEPSFIFVHKLTDDERAKLTADALGIAKADAQRLAVAAQQTLGAIKELSLTATPSDASNPYAAYIQAMSGSAQPSPSAAPSEVTGDQASVVTATVDVSVSFEMH